MLGLLLFRKITDIFVSDSSKKGGRIHLSVIARKKGGGPVTEKICTQAAGLYINILYARAKNQPSHWEKMQSHVGDIAPWSDSTRCISENIEWLIEDQAFSPSKDLASPPLPTPPLQSVSSTGDTQEAWSSITHSILSAAYIPAGIYLANRSLIGNSQQIKRLSPQLQRFYNKTMYYIRSNIDISR